MTDYKGDDTGFGGNAFITITLSNPSGFVLTKAQFVVNSGCIRKDFINPVFPLVVNFSSEDTGKLNYRNTGYLIVWDENNRPKQCDGHIDFTFANGVIECQN